MGLGTISLLMILMRVADSSAFALWNPLCRSSDTDSPVLTRRSDPLTTSPTATLPTPRVYFPLLSLSTRIVRIPLSTWIAAPQRPTSVPFLVRVVACDGLIGSYPSSTPQYTPTY
jgi:hypothetical protein